MAMLVLSQIRILKMQVEVGFVVGVTEPTMPAGLATRLVSNALSSENTPQVFCGGSSSYVRARRHSYS